MRRIALWVAVLSTVFVMAATCEGDQCTEAGKYFYKAEQKDLVCKDTGNGELRWVKVKEDDL